MDIENDSDIDDDEEKSYQKCGKTDEDSVSSLSSLSNNTNSDKTSSIDEDADNPLWREEALGTPIDEWLPPLDETPIPLPNEDIWNCFEWMFDKEIYELIARETNTYARKSMVASCEAKGMKPKEIEEYINNRWKDTDIDDLKTFLGLCIIMGIMKKPQVGEYWTETERYKTPVFNCAMPRNRFSDIMQFFHLCPTKNIGGPYHHVKKNDRLEKVGHLLEMLKERWNKYKKPSKNLTIDESMISFKGKICFKQYIPRKKHKWGIKCWVLAGSADSYIYEVQIYTGKSESIESNLGKKVVIDLSKNLSPGHVLYFDSYFSSVGLFEELQKVGIGAVGMLKKNSRGLPKDFYNQKLKSGEGKVLVHRDFSNIKAVKSKDTKMYFIMTSCTGTNEVEVQRFNSKDKSFINTKRIACVADYSENMHGVDRFDQMCSYYSYKRKTIKWWKHVFFYLLEVSLNNAYILFKQNYKGPKMVPRKHFRLSIVEKLFEKNEKYHTAVRRNKDRLTIYHFPLLYENYRSLCMNCLKNRNKKTVSRYYCESCEVSLCIMCFEEYHEKLEVREGYIP